jgi:hypothetical protein
MTIDDDKWYPFTFPLPNMMVQAGREVHMKDLTSDAGQSLNGKKGKALMFHMENGRWSIELEDGTHKSFRIQNLEFRGDVLICFTCQRGLDLVGAGTMAGEPALMIFDNPRRPGFNLELIKEQFLLMGVPLGLLVNNPLFAA